MMRKLKPMLKLRFSAPRELVERLRTRAKAKGRTVSAEIIIRLQDSFETADALDGSLATMSDFIVEYEARPPEVPVWL